MANRTRPPLRVVHDTESPPPGRNRRNLFELAYEQLEELIVTCRLKPGAYHAISDLQDILQVGRTPTHQAVSRLATDTLIIIRARQGLQIAPVNLARERMLLRLRRDMEAFVIRLAVERAGPTHRNRILHIARILRERGSRMTLAEFNQFDRQIDHLIATAAGEPFLEHTLRPLHTISRRIGWIYHSWMGGKSGLDGTVGGHLEILEAMAAGQSEAAVAATGRLLDFADSMFSTLETGISPVLLDSSLGVLEAG